MASSNVHLVDELELAFQNCMSALTNQEHFNITDQDEVKTSVEQSIQKFLDVARQLEVFFLQKRLLLSVHKPEQIVKEDVAELRQELIRKEALIQKHYEKLPHWLAMLKQGQQSGSQSQSSAGPSGTQGQVPAPQGQPIPAQIPNQLPGQASGSQPLPSQNMYPQGPLAYLEQTTSNIGMPERR